MTERTGLSSRRHKVPTMAPRTRREVNRRAVRRPTEATEEPKRGGIETASSPESWPQRVKREPLNPVSLQARATKQRHEEARQRIEGLRPRISAEQALRTRLAECQQGMVCGTPACPNCAFAYKLWLTTNMVAVFRSETELFWVTLWRPEDQRPLGELNGIEVQREKDNLGKRLRAVGLGEARVIGGLEVKYAGDKSGDGEWLPHFHLVVAGASQHELEKLRKYYSGPRQLHIEPITHRLPRVLSYLAKFTTYAKSEYEGNDGRARQQVYRPKRAIHNEHLLWLGSE